MCERTNSRCFSTSCRTKLVLPTCSPCSRTLGSLELLECLNLEALECPRLAMLPQATGHNPAAMDLNREWLPLAMDKADMRNKDPPEGPMVALLPRWMVLRCSSSSNKAFPLMLMVAMKGVNGRPLRLKAKEKLLPTRQLIIDKHFLKEKKQPKSKKNKY